MLTVGAILKESPEAVRRFVAWYRGQGATRIVLVFDDPADPMADALADQPDITVLRATAAFWEELGVTRETRFTRRQNLAMGRVYRGLETGWFLNVDCDELVLLEGRSLACELAGQPDDIAALRILPAEPVQTPDDAETLHVRLPQQPWLQRALYGDAAEAVAPRGGLMGHTVGKSATRAGLGAVRMRQHWLERGDGAIEGPRLGAEAGAYLLHFVDQGFETWRGKIAWRLSSRGFRLPMRRRIEACLAAPEPEAELRALYDLLHVFPADRRATLARGGALKSWPRAVLGL